MVRKQICIEAELDRALIERASQRGISQGELVRQALRHELEGQHPPALVALWEEIEADLERRAARGALEGGRTWTRDDAYDD